MLESSLGRSCRSMVFFAASSLRRSCRSMVLLDPAAAMAASSMKVAAIAVAEVSRSDLALIYL